MLIIINVACQFRMRYHPYNSIITQAPLVLVFFLLNCLEIIIFMFFCTVLCDRIMQCSFCILQNVCLLLVLYVVR